MLSGPAKPTVVLLEFIYLPDDIWYMAAVAKLLRKMRKLGYDCPLVSLKLGGAGGRAAFGRVESVERVVAKLCVRQLRARGDLVLVREHLDAAWCQPNAIVPYHPTVTEFLRGPDKSLK